MFISLWAAGNGVFTHYLYQTGVIVLLGRKQAMLKVNQIYKLDARAGMGQLDTESVDCIITSPPYWNPESPNYGIPDVNWGDWTGSLGLEPSSAMYIDHLEQVFSEGKRVLTKLGFCYVVLGDTYIYPGYCLIPDSFLGMMAENGWHLKNRIIWYKGSSIQATDENRFIQDFDYIFLFTKYKTSMAMEKVGTYNRCENSAIWDYPSGPKPGQVFETFPPELATRMVLSGSHKKDLIVDPFCGKGPLFSRARALKRNFICFDLGYEGN